MEFKRILVPLDGSELSMEALKPAEVLARTFGGQVRLTTVEELPDQPEPGEWDLTLGSFLDKKRAETEQALQATADRMRQQGLTVSHNLLPLGPPSGRILEEAEQWGADLIVVCSHSRHGLARWLMGSTAERISRGAPCPVMIVHHKVGD